MKKYSFILTLELSDPGNEKQMKHVEENILSVLKKADNEGQLLWDLELNTIDKIIIKKQTRSNDPSPEETLQGHFKPDAE